MNMKLGPITISLLIHALIAAAFLVSWKSNSEPKRIIPPTYIEAKLVKLKTETKRVPQKKKPKKVDLTKRNKPSPPKKARPAPAAKKVEKKKTKIDDQKAKEDARKKAEALRKQQERMRMLEELEQDLKAEDLSSAENESEQEALSYKQIIFNRIRDNWSRPPSARTGMKCELVIEMVPTGRVVSVSVVKSSGNSAFDRSALQAVHKAESFPELKEMSPSTFEKYYRRFHLIFNPQDLRQ